MKRHLTAFCLALCLVPLTACGKPEAPVPTPSSHLIGGSSEEAPAEAPEAPPTPTTAPEAPTSSATPTPAPETPAELSLRFQVPFQVNGESSPRRTVSLLCPADWENDGIRISHGGKKLIEFDWYNTTEEPEPGPGAGGGNWLEQLRDGEEKTLGDRIFRAAMVEVTLLDHEEKQTHPYRIYTYYTEGEGGWCGVTLFQNQDTMPTTLETFEAALSTLTIREGAPSEGGIILNPHIFG